MHDPGMVYLIGYVAMFVVAAVTLLFAKRSLEARGEKTKLTSKHINALWSVAGVLTVAGVVKITVFADFYAANSMYMPA